MGFLHGQFKKKKVKFSPITTSKNIKYVRSVAFLTKRLDNFFKKQGVPKFSLPPTLRQLRNRFSDK